jgi:hypothetical protein
MTQMRVDCGIGWVSNQIDGRNYYEEKKGIKGEEEGNFVLVSGLPQIRRRSQQKSEITKSLSHISVYLQCKPRVPQVAYTRLGQWRLHDSLVQRLGCKLNP